MLALKEEVNTAKSHANHLETALAKAHETETQMSTDIKSYKEDFKIEKDLKQMREKPDKDTRTHCLHFS